MRKPGEEYGEDAGAARTISLSQMQTLIGAWFAKSGFLSVRSAPQTASGHEYDPACDGADIVTTNRERERGPSAVPTNVVPFGGAVLVPHPQE